jgi:hypothetical protein
VINGVVTQGQTLTASNSLADADGLGLINYTWKTDGTAVSTGTTYILTEASVGKVMTVEQNTPGGKKRVRLTRVYSIRGSGGLETDVSTA